MLNFEEELQKFSPMMEVDDVEESLYREDMSDTEDRNATRRQPADREDARR